MTSQEKLDKEAASYRGAAIGAGLGLSIIGLGILSPTALIAVTLLVGVVGGLAFLGWHLGAEFL